MSALGLHLKVVSVESLIDELVDTYLSGKHQEPLKRGRDGWHCWHRIEP